ncbi:substrate-binding domain-containing protein [Amycolatopsis sp. QT-25]|uniref:substrate-binding domain-containing protein n=1 Tax=Amycolatopsis sp. QT-25 TaxID=3034022 RepID=UPI0023ECBE40|nr:substrate-binding domain-containing protein [Amycolatopsis sp. QT-25]WET76515.1 substrate-binding domain-containing protein [Amycolatopsis sp. QT-25]
MGKDMAIVGFDNDEESAYSLPSLTTIAPDRAAIARTAAHLLRRRIAGGSDLEPEDGPTSFSLEIRNSTIVRHRN